MAVIIKGIEMPKNCGECPCFADGWFCNLLDDKCRAVYDGRPDRCPLIEIKETCATCAYVCNKKEEPCNICTDTDSKWEPFREGE